MRFRRYSLLIALVVAATGVPAAAELYTDWLWFAHVGYESVFLKSLGARALLTVLSGLVVFALLGGNLMLSLRALRPRAFMVSTPHGPQTVTMDARRIKRPAIGAAALVSLLTAFAAGAQWETWLYYLHGTPFGRVDPVIGRDIGFYLFTLPLLERVHGLLMLLTLLTAGATLGVYVLGEEVGLEQTHGLLVSRRATRHLAGLAALLFVVLGFGAWLQIPQLLTSTSGNMTGATYADVHARMPALWVLVAAALLSAALSVWQAVTVGRLWPLAAAAGLYIVVSVGGSAYAATIQRFVVAPNEQVRETEFITHNIGATRAAYALDGVTEQPLAGDTNLTRADLDRNTATLANVPLWNDRPLLDTFGQIQEIRTYYDFHAVDNDRYMIDGQYRQIMLSARELNSESLPSRTWINEHLTFTHGYGLTLGPVNEVTQEGLPVLFIKDLPLVSTVDLQVTQPAIYFGELQNDHVFVKTKTEEFDYPRGDANVSAAYTGGGGVPLSNVFRRLMFAIRFRSTDTFFSPNLTEESRVMMYRRIAQRVERIMPSLSYDPDPYLTITDGRLVWMQDAYTTSRRYPYSTAAGGLNYIRNSIKVTVDAYDGTTTYHVVDPADPIARTIGRIFPDLLKPLEAMPETLRTRLRYPQQIFAIQAAMFATFHMTNPAVFYNREDQWEIPSFESGGQQPAPMHPYYTIMKLPGEQGAEYHPDAAVHAAGQGQSRGVDGRAQRRGQLRTAGRVPVPQADGGVRAEAGGSAHQPGSGDLAADHAVEPAGFGSDPGNAARHSHRGIADLYPSPLPARRRRSDPGVEAGHRRLSQQHRHGRDVDGGAGPDSAARQRALHHGRRGYGRHAPSRNGSPGNRRHDVAVAGGGGAGALHARDPGTARRELGALRRGDQKAGRGARADAQGEASLRVAAASRRNAPPRVQGNVAFCCKVIYIG